MIMKQVKRRERGDVPLWDARHPDEELERPFPIPFAPRGALMIGWATTLLPQSWAAMRIRLPKRDVC